MLLHEGPEDTGDSGNSFSLFSLFSSLKELTNNSVNEFSFSALDVDGSPTILIEDIVLQLMTVININ